MSYILTLHNQKGGVGKTTISLLAARLLSQAGIKTLLIDSDPQKTLTYIVNRFYGADSKGRERTSKGWLKEFMSRNWFDVLVGRRNVEDCIFTLEDQLDFIPSDPKLSELATPPTSAASDALRTVKRRYQAIVFDLGPAWNGITHAAHVAADCVIIPSPATLEELEQAAYIFNRSRQINKKARARVLLNGFNVDRPSRTEREALDLFPGIEFFAASLPYKRSLIRRYTATGERMTRDSETKREYFEAFVAFIREATPFEINGQVQEF
jgi:chromosome partitioning protein